MRTTWVAASLLAGIGMLAVPAESQAGVGVSIFVRGDRDRYDRGYRAAYSIGFDNGRADGARSGARDARGHDDYGFRHDRRYRDGDSGYRRQYGPRHEYVSGYRNGYEEGYRSAFRRNRRDGRDDDRRRGRYDY